MDRVGGELLGGRYRLERPLASGGMGAVWVARHLDLDIELAIKFRSETGQRAGGRSEVRFHGEARLAAQLRSPYIVHVHDFGIDRGQQYLVMDLLQGEDLKRRLERTAPLPVAVFARLLAQATKGLTYAHASGIVHRDIKPGNLFLALVGNEEILTILDFGIAVDHRLPGRDDTTVGTVVGSPSYMSPEQAQGEVVDHRTDLWSLAVVAFQAVVGTHPFRGKNYFDTLQRICSASFPRPSELTENAPPALDEFFDKAFALQLKRRFDTAEELDRAFAQIAERYPTLLLVPRRALSGDASGESAFDSEEASWRSGGTRSINAALAPAAQIDHGTPAPSWFARATALNPASASHGSSQRSDASNVRAETLDERAPRRRVWFAVTTASVLLATAVALWQGWKSVPSVTLSATPGMLRFGGGNFALGSTAEEVAAMCASYPQGCPKEVQNEVPPRPVTLAAFELDVHEVTNAEFAAFLHDLSSSTRIIDDDDSHLPRFVHYQSQAVGGKSELLYDWWRRAAGVQPESETRPFGGFKARPGFENLPVTLVTLAAARLYCRSQGKRLPTEAEWEWAARGQAKRQFPWGNEPPSCRGVHLPSDGTLELRDPNLCDNTRLTPFPVMTSPQDVTPEGIFDLGGNVTEWVEPIPQVGDAARADTTAAADMGILRGGAFDSSFYTRPTSRALRLASSVSYALGFRCAK